MKTKAMTVAGALLLGLLTFRAARGAEDLAPDKKGFIRDWPGLGPIQLESDANGGDAIEKNQIPDEGMLKPKAGDKVTVGGKELTWKKVKTSDYFLDLNAMLNAQTEKTVGYAVCYVQSEKERKNQTA